MRVLKYFGVAFESIASHKLRAMLTMLGIIIGVAAVLLTMGIGSGAAASITSQIEGQGVNLLTISPSGGSSRLTLGDAQVLANPALHPEIALVAPQYSGNGTLVSGANDLQGQVVGVTAAYALVNNVEVAQGRFITDQEVTNIQRVAVVGWNVARDLYRGNAIGQTLRINNEFFDVVGVLTQEGGGGFGSNDDRAFVPISVAQSRLFNAPRYRGEYTLTALGVQVANRDLLDVAEVNVERTLRLRHGLGVNDDNDFTIFNQATLLTLVGTVTGTLTILLGSIGAVSLLVGGIGIMNIMLVSVTERTREIGLRKALGAHDSDILLQFVIEALVLCALGGAIGIGVSYGIAALVNYFFGDTFQLIIEPYALVLALAVSTGSGFVFGLYPAQRATQLDPIEALRFE
jgi:putative ABC transport system permease protein